MTNGAPVQATSSLNAHSLTRGNRIIDRNGWPQIVRSVSYAAEAVIITLWNGTEITRGTNEKVQVVL